MKEITKNNISRDKRTLIMLLMFVNSRLDIPSNLKICVNNPRKIRSMYMMINNVNNNSRLPLLTNPKMRILEIINTRKVTPKIKLNG